MMRKEIMVEMVVMTWVSYLQKPFRRQCLQCILTPLPHPLPLYHLVEDTFHDATMPTVTPYQVLIQFVDDLAIPYLIHIQSILPNHHV